MNGESGEVVPFKPKVNPSYREFVEDQIEDIKYLITNGFPEYWIINKEPQFKDYFDNWIYEIEMNSYDGNEVFDKIQALMDSDWKKYAEKFKFEYGFDLLNYLGKYI